MRRFCRPNLQLRRPDCRISRKWFLLEMAGWQCYLLYVVRHSGWRYDAYREIELARAEAERLEWEHRSGSGRSGGSGGGMSSGKRNHQNRTFSCNCSLTSKAVSQSHGPAAICVAYHFQGAGSWGWFDLAGTHLINQSGHASGLLEFLG